MSKKTKLKKCIKRTNFGKIIRIIALILILYFASADILTKILLFYLGVAAESSYEKINVLYLMSRNKKD